MNQVEFEDAGLLVPENTFDLNVKYNVFEPNFYSGKDIYEAEVSDFTVLLEHPQTKDKFVVGGKFFSGAGGDDELTVLNMDVEWVKKVIGVDENGDLDMEFLFVPRKVTICVYNTNVLMVMTKVCGDCNEVSIKGDKFIAGLIK